jgi:threonyl-tRNA synthetase
LPLNDQKEVKEYSESLQKELLSNNFRSKIWSSKETLNRRIEQTYKKKIPFYVVIGKKEVNNEKLTVHYIYSGKSGEPEILTKEELVGRLQPENKSSYENSNNEHDKI